MTMLVALTAFAEPAQAYIDPGTGGQLLSSLGIIIGIACTGIAMAYAFIKQWGGLLLTKIRSRLPGGHTTEETTESP
jgi:hypothetical protein